ncbi:hypothetical protein ACIQOW_12260 [Kitasatospora sp. NPDC091335]|uniref:hypothetical protein n=1 Tax=Kitasatospora sp. NPDC091335 TaxID=3364085 RepID=UPI00382496EA
MTANLKGFPESCLAEWGIEAKSPDDFVLDLIGLDDRVVYSCVQEIADARRNPPTTFEDVLGILERSGLIEVAAALRAGPMPIA